MFKFLAVIYLAITSRPVVSQSIIPFHANAIVVDSHNDILSKIVQKGYDVGDRLAGKTHTDLGRLKQGGIDIQVFSVFCNQRYGAGTAFQYALREFDSLHNIAARYPESLLLAYTYNDLKAAIREKKIAAVAGVEGGHMIEDKLEYLDSLYLRGARYMTLTWNNSTSWATSAADESKGVMPFGSKGLTDFGKDVVRRMNHLGMIVDLSHVGEQTFRDVINTSTKPVIASHSSVYNLCPHPRNLKDDQLKAIARNGGVIFVNFYSGFIDSNYMGRKEVFLQQHRREADSLTKNKWTQDEVEDWLFDRYSIDTETFRAPFSLLMDHFEYIIKLIGVDHVGLGSDFDGIESTPDGLNGVQDFPKISQALLQKGYSKKDIRKILGGNFLRVFKTVTANK